MLLSILASVISPSENINFYHVLSELYDISPQDLIKLMELKKLKFKSLRILIDGIVESKYENDLSNFSGGFLKKCELIKNDMDFFSDICVKSGIRDLLFHIINKFEFKKKWTQLQQLNVAKYFSLQVSSLILDFLK